MHGTSQNRAEYDPQEDNRTEAGTHQGSEYRPRAGNIEKLDKRGLSWLHRHTVDTVIDGNGRCRTIIRRKHLFYKRPLNSIPDHQQDQGCCKCNH